MSFTRIPNEIIDFYMGKLSHAQFKVLIFILRKTLGWNKKSDIISLSQITSACGISKPTAVTALKELNDMGLISTQKNTKVGKKISLGGKIVLPGVLNLSLIHI